jgi:3-deoxy-7-phosphoheptulonate synthase
MIVLLRPDVPEAERDNVRRALRALAAPVVERALGARHVFETPATADACRCDIERMPGVERVFVGEPPAHLTLRDTHPADTRVRIGGAVFGGTSTVVIAGPCAVEDRDTLLAIAAAVKAGGARMLRGGAFKPRTSPYAFQGLGRAGLELLAEAREATGLPVVTEVLDTRDVELVAEFADMLQIGSRSMHNFALLHEVGRTRVPVLLKRGMSATLDELLTAAEYVLAGGNENVVLCERGIRTFERNSRNTLDLTAVPLLKERTHLPVIVDPSHAGGRRSLVRPLTLAAVAAGADGVLVDVHVRPESALCDGLQAIEPAEFEALVAAIGALDRALVSPSEARDPRPEPVV